MRLPDKAHTSRPWRIHELTRGFKLEDVWALPTPGGPGGFHRLVQLMASTDPSRGSSRAARALWAIRAPEARSFIERAAREGVHAVVRDRDAPFADYSTAEPARKPAHENTIGPQP